MEFKGSFVIKGVLKAKTGLHIGAQAAGIVIGKTDNPIVKQVNENGERIPYIPGSSLKGKIRSLLEEDASDGAKKFFNIEVQGKPGRHECEGDNPCDICVVFGRGAEWKAEEGPTRTIFRDAMINEKSVKNNDLVEIKWENTISRVTSEAMPRDVERVTRGAEFPFEVIYKIYDEDLDGGEIKEETKLEEFPEKLKKRIKLIYNGFSLLEDDYLGGSGTRGYGQVEFKLFDIKLRKNDYYGGQSADKDIISDKSLREIIEIL